MFYKFVFAYLIICTKKSQQGVFSCEGKLLFQNTAVSVAIIS